MKQQNISKQSVQHGRSRTRNQRKRERTESAFMVFSMLMVWVMFLAVVLQVWSCHPAEAPVDGRSYLESIQYIGGDSDA